jgi:hypothetical protein
MTEEPSKVEKGRSDVRNKPMPTEDKVLLAVLGLVAIAVLAGLRWLLSGMFGIAVGASAGVGFRDAFIAAIVLSISLMIMFAVVAGDGALGELTTMVIGFFVMVAFFTVTIALIL